MNTTPIFLRRLSLPLVLLLSALSVAASQCPNDREIIAGRGIGPVRVGMRYADVKSYLGDLTAFGADGVLLARVPAESVELVFAAPGASLTDDSEIVAVSALAGGEFQGDVRPGDTRASVEAELGAPSDMVGRTAYYTAGLSVTYDGDAAESVASQVAVFAAYSGMERAPEMRAARTRGRTRPRLDGRTIDTVDMHLHPGQFGRIPASTKQFLVGSIPPFLKPYAAALLQRAVSPYAPHLGIRAQTERAGVDHAVLFAVYTQNTTGFLTNEELETMLTDPRNRAADGLPWAFGLASINFFDGYVDAQGRVDERVARSRLSALSSYFERRPDLFIGIKLAHAHQAVAFDDPRYLGVYDVAAARGVPVYLHTGFTPFPQGANTPPYYDPEGLENTIENLPDVTFILGHVGQGDARAVEHALSLAERHDNVYLEISALGRPLVVDDEGAPITTPNGPPQITAVVAQIKARGLVNKTLYGSDGPQSAGMVPRYTKLVTDTLSAAGYSADEIHAVMAGNFARVFFGSN